VRREQADVLAVSHDTAQQLDAALPQNEDNCNPRCIEDLLAVCSPPGPCLADVRDAGTYFCRVDGGQTAFKPVLPPGSTKTGRKIIYYHPDRTVCTAFDPKWGYFDGDGKPIIAYEYPDGGVNIRLVHCDGKTFTVYHKAQWCINLIYDKYRKECPLGSCPGDPPWSRDR
jgi:hypothetical protein